MKHVVDCRIGSLEKHRERIFLVAGVDCRIGSLEIISVPPLLFMNVDCRIGSLEIMMLERGMKVDC